MDIDFQDSANIVRVATEYELAINEDNPTSIDLTSTGTIYAGVNRSSKAVKNKENDHLRVFQITSDGIEQPVATSASSKILESKDSLTVDVDQSVVLERNESILPVSSLSLFASGSPDEYQKCTKVNSVTNTLAICNSLHGPKASICVLSVSPEDPQQPPTLRYRTPTNNSEEVNDLDISSDGQFVAYVTDTSMTVLPAFADGKSAAQKPEKSVTVSTVAPICVKDVPANICPAGSVFAKVSFLANNSLLVAINHPKRSGSTLATFQFNVSKSAEKSSNSEKSQNQGYFKLSTHRKILSKSSVTSLDTFVSTADNKTAPLAGYAAFSTADDSVGAVILPSLTQVFLERNAHTFAVTKVSLSPVSGSVLASVSADNTVAVYELEDPVTKSQALQQAQKRKMTIIYTLLSAIVLVVTAIVLQMILQYKVLGDLMQKAYNVKEMQSDDSKTEFSGSSNVQQQDEVTLTTATAMAISSSTTEHQTETEATLDLTETNFEATVDPKETGAVVEEWIKDGEQEKYEKKNDDGEYEIIYSRENLKDSKHKYSENYHSPEQPEENEDDANIEFETVHSREEHDASESNAPEATEIHEEPAKNEEHEEPQHPIEAQETLKPETRKESHVHEESQNPTEIQQTFETEAPEVSEEPKEHEELENTVQTHETLEAEGSEAPIETQVTVEVQETIVVVKTVSVQKPANDEL